MGLKIRRSISIFKGLKLNISKSGVSTTVGKKGASVTFGKKRARVNVGIPGTGISYSKEVKEPIATNTEKSATQEFILSMNQDGYVTIKYSNGQVVTDPNLLEKITQSEGYKEEVNRLNILRENKNGLFSS